MQPAESTHNGAHAEPSERLLASKAVNSDNANQAKRAYVLKQISTRLRAPSSSGESSLVHSLPCPAGAAPQTRHLTSGVRLSSAASSPLAATSGKAAGNEATETPLTDPLALNWCDLDDIVRLSDHLQSNHRSLLKLLEWQQTDFSDDFDCRYFRNAPLLIGLGASKLVDRYVRCGHKEGLGQVFCEKPLFCYRCACFKQLDLLAMFANCFHKGTFHSLTVSFAGSLPFDSVNGVQVRSHWDALNRALKAMIASEAWSGAFWVNEVAIVNVAPLRVLPHAHAVVHSDQITPEQINELSALISGYIGTGDEPVEIALTPSIKHELIVDEESFEKAIRYLHKPINLYEHYERAWDAMLSGADLTAQHINRSMRDFVEGIPVVTTGFHRSHYAGSCMSQKKWQFIGVQKSDRVSPAR